MKIKQPALPAALTFMSLLLPTAVMQAMDGHVFTFAGSAGPSQVIVGNGYGVIVETPPGHSGRGAGKFIFVQGPPPEFRMIDDARQTYMVMNEETTRAAAEKMTQMQGQFGGQLPSGGPLAGGLASIPPETLKKLQDAQAAMRQARKMRGGASADVPPEVPTGPIEIRKTSQRATHAGHPCTKHEGWRGGVKIREYWITDWRNVPGGSAAQKMIEEMRRAHEKIMGSFTEKPASGVKTKPGGDSFETWTKLGGFPVVTRTFADDELVDESILQSSRQRSLAPPDFQPDLAYGRIEMFAKTIEQINGMGA